MFINLTGGPSCAVLYSRKPTSPQLRKQPWCSADDKKWYDSCDTYRSEKFHMSFGFVSFIKVIFNEMSKLEQAFLYNGLWFSGYRKKFATHWTRKKIENSHYLVTCAFRVQMVNLLSLCFRIVETFCLYFFYISWLICWLYIYLLTYFVACFQCFILFLSHFTISLDWPLRSL